MAPAPDHQNDRGFASPRAAPAAARPAQPRGAGGRFTSPDASSTASKNRKRPIASPATPERPSTNASAEISFNWTTAGVTLVETRCADVVKCERGALVLKELCEALRWVQTRIREGAVVSPQRKRRGRAARAVFGDITNAAATAPTLATYVDSRWRRADRDISSRGVVATSGHGGTLTRSAARDGRALLRADTLVLIEARSNLDLEAARDWLVSSIEAVASMHDKDVLKYVRETHQKALAHNRELANPLTWANVRREWDEAAKEMDCFFEEVATLATSEAQYTGRSTARAPPDTLIKCAKVIMAKPALKRFVAPLLDAAGELSAADDEVRDAKIDAEATDVRDALVASSRARRRGVAVVKLALGMIPLMQLMRIGNQKQLRHFNIVYGEVSDAASSFTAPSWSPTRHRRDHVFVSTARRSSASPTIARLTIPCTQVMRSEYARDAFLDAHSAAGQNASHQQLNAFEAEYTKAVARNLAATLEARPDQQLVIIADNVVLTVNHQDQRAERASSSQIDATVVVALLVPRDHGLGDDKPQYVCVTQDVEAFGYSFAEIASGARSAQGEVYLPTIDGTPRAIGDCFIATLEDGHRLEFVKIKSAADVMRECPGWGGFEPVLPYTRSAGHLFEYQLHDSPRPRTGTVYGDASNERPTMQELYDDCLRREAYEMLYEAVERYDVARPRGLALPKPVCRRSERTAQLRNESSFEAATYMTLPTSLYKEQVKRQLALLLLELAKFHTGPATGTASHVPSEADDAPVEDCAGRCCALLAAEHQSGVALAAAELSARRDANASGGANAMEVGPRSTEQLAREALVRAEFEAAASVGGKLLTPDVVAACLCLGERPPAFTKDAPWPTAKEWVSSDAAKASQTTVRAAWHFLGTLYADRAPDPNRWTPRAGAAVARGDGGVTIFGGDLLTIILGKSATLTSAQNLVELVERPIASDVEEVAAKQVFDALSGFEPVFGRWHKKAHQNVAILSSDWDFGGEDLKRMLWC